MTYAKGPIVEYLRDLAEKMPAPGGGSAAALEAAMGCSLISMVSNYTVSNKLYKDFKDRAAECLNKSEKLRERLIGLVDEDIDAYKKLSAGIKSPKKDPSVSEKLYKDACNIPFEVCNIVSEAITLLRGLVEYGNKNLITDSAAASYMLESAFYGAKFNVYINLRHINDGPYIERIHKNIKEFEETIPRLKEEIVHICEEVIMK